MVLVPDQEVLDQEVENIVQAGIEELTNGAEGGRGPIVALVHGRVLEVLEGLNQKENKAEVPIQRLLEERANEEGEESIARQEPRSAHGIQS